MSTRTSTFSSLEIQNTTTIINNNNNNKHNNDKNNNSNSKEKNNTLITIALPKTDANFNHVAVREEKAPVSKKVLLRQNTNIEKHPQKNQIHLPKLKDGKSTRELKSDNSSCVTCFVQNLSILWTYVTNTCKSRHIFPNFFTGLCFYLFSSSLFRHFTIVDEPTLNLNFYSYSTITGIFSRTDHIGFHEKYFLKYGTRRKDLENSHITLHSKKI